MSFIDFEEKFKMIEKYWHPTIVGELNGQYVKLAKLHKEFIFHFHENEDEMFMVTKGILIIQLKDEENSTDLREVKLETGQAFIVPRKMWHKPIVPPESMNNTGIAHVVLFEPKTVINTGNVENERTHKNLESI